MATLIHEPIVSGQHEESLKLVAKSLFQELKVHGYQKKHVVSLCSELLSLIITELADRGAPTEIAPKVGSPFAARHLRLTPPR